MSETPLLYMNFNQDSTSLGVGMKNGYRLYAFNGDKLECIYEEAEEEVYIVERLFSSSLVALVTLHSPRKLKINHFKKGTEICNYSYSNTVLSVRLNRVRLVVCLEDSIYIHNIRDMKVLHTITETPRNPKGIIALCVDNECSYLAYPGNNQSGEIHVFDTINVRNLTMIPAHNSAIAQLAFNSSGCLLATASEKGTLIRVFKIPDGSRQYELRRGVARCADINSLSFSNDSMLLCCSSNTETIHVFKLNPDEQETEPKTEEEHGSGWMAWFGQMANSASTMLPGQVGDMMHQKRSVYTAKLPTYGKRNVACLATISGEPSVLAASQDSYLYVYRVPLADKGSIECSLVKQHRIDGKKEEETLTADSELECGFMEVYEKKIKGDQQNLVSTKEIVSVKTEPIEIPPSNPDEKSIIEQPSSVSQQPAKIVMDSEQRILSPKVVCSMENLCGDYNIDGDFLKKDV